MVEFKCDFCGRHFRYSRDEYNTIQFVTENPYNSFGVEDCSDGFNLCPNCVNKIMSMIRKEALEE